MEAQTPYGALRTEPVYEIRLSEKLRRGVLAELDRIEKLPDHLWVLRNEIIKADPNIKF